MTSPDIQPHPRIPDHVQIDTEVVLYKKLTHHDGIMITLLHMGRVGAFPLLEPIKVVSMIYKYGSTLKIFEVHFETPEGVINKRLSERTVTFCATENDATYLRLRGII